MAEQRPFKSSVEGSSPSDLTKNCHYKIHYKTLEQAKDHAIYMKLNYGRRLEAYWCTKHDCYHLDSSVIRKVVNNVDS